MLRLTSVWQWEHEYLVALHLRWEVCTPSSPFGVQGATTAPAAPAVGFSLHLFYCSLSRHQPLTVSSPCEQEEEPSGKMSYLTSALSGWELHTAHISGFGLHFSLKFGAFQGRWDSRRPKGRQRRWANRRSGDQALLGSIPLEWDISSASSLKTFFVTWVRYSRQSSFDPWIWVIVLVA